MKRTLPFVFSFFLNYILLFLLYPSLSYDSKFWAESSTLYLYQTEYLGIWNALLALDAGYLGHFSMFLAYLISLFHFPLQLLPTIYNNFSLVFIAVCCSSLCLPIFKKMINSDLIRFIISTGLILHSDYDLKTFINMAYYGLIPFLLILFQMKSFKNTPILICLLLGCFLFFLEIGKPYFLIFMPILLMIFTWIIKMKYYRISFIILPPIVGGFIQLMVSFYSINQWKKTHPTNQLSNFQLFSFDSVYTLFIHSFEILFSSFGILLFILLIISFAFKQAKIANFRKLNIFKYFWIFFVFSSVLIGNIAINTISNLYIVPTFTPPNYSNLSNRWYFFGTTVSILFYSILSNQLIHSISKKLFYFALFFLFSKPFFSLDLQKLQSYNELVMYNFENWKEFLGKNNVVERKNFCAPINPYPWTFRCNHVIPPPSASEIQFPNYKEINKNTYYSIPDEAYESEIEFISIFFDKKIFENSVSLQIYDKNKNFLGGANLINPNKKIFSFFKLEKKLKHCSYFKIINIEDDKKIGFSQLNNQILMVILNEW